MLAFLIVAAAGLVGGAQDNGSSDPSHQISLKQEEPQQPPAGVAAPRQPLLLQDEESSPWVDFDWLEIQPHVGMAIFTEDYHIGPSPFLSLLVRAPVPLLSLGSPDDEYFGLFAEAGFMPSVSRDIFPKLDKSSGSVMFGNFGLDFTFIRNQSLYLGIKVGAQYAWYGGITDLVNGFATMGGLDAGVYLGSGMTLTLAPEVTFGNAGDRIYLASLGMLIEF